MAHLKRHTSCSLSKADAIEAVANSTVLMHSSCGHMSMQEQS